MIIHYNSTPKLLSQRIFIKYLIFLLKIFGFVAPWRQSRVLFILFCVFVYAFSFSFAKSAINSSFCSEYAESIGATSLPFFLSK